jgi:hypothetical protein
LRACYRAAPSGEEYYLHSPGYIKASIQRGQCSVRSSSKLREINELTKNIQLVSLKPEKDLLTALFVQSWRSRFTPGMPEITFGSLLVILKEHSGYLL